MSPDVAASAHFPGGHIEGWPDAFKNMMLNFYRAVKDGKMPARDEARFASFYDGANVMFIIDAILQSHAKVGDGVLILVDLAGGERSAKHRFLCGAAGMVKERGVPLYPFTCSEVTFRHEHTVNGTHPSRPTHSLPQGEGTDRAHILWGSLPLYDRAPNP
jgi:hypothetical protein